MKTLRLKKRQLYSNFQVFSILLCFMVFSCKDANKKSLTDAINTDDNFLMEIKETPKNGGLLMEDATFWGASVIKVADEYQMFVSSFSNRCGVKSWKHNSIILRVSSNNPLGPFKIKDTVVQAMAHNPAIRVAPNGNYYLFYIGETVSEDQQVQDCENGRTIEKKPAYNSRSCIVNYIESSSIEGPWSEPKILMDLESVENCATNPSPFINPDGSIRMYYRAYDPEVLPVKERYLYLTQSNGIKDTLKNSDLKVIQRIAEDPFVWKMNNKFHVLFNNKFYDKLNTGGYATSIDGVHFDAEEPLYSRRINFDNGESIVSHRRERPHFLKIDEKRAVLYTGVWKDTISDFSFIAATPIGHWTKDQLQLAKK